MKKKIAICGICGIYIIENSSYFYIGQSRNIRTRMIRHKSHLKHNKHENIFMQNVYNKNNDSDPLIGRILCQCELLDLSIKEVEYYNKFCSCNKTPMNLAPCGQGVLKISEEYRKLLSDSHIGITHSESTKKKMSDSRLGVKHSKEWCQNISNSTKGKPRLELRGENHRLSIKIVQLSKCGELVKI